VVLLRHEPSGVEVDLSIAWLPFERDALAASELLDLAGTRVAVARAEDLIIYKAVAFRPQDQQDIERLLVLHRRTIDLDPSGGLSANSPPLWMNPSESRTWTASSAARVCPEPRRLDDTSATSVLCGRIGTLAVRNGRFVQSPGTPGPCRRIVGIAGYRVIAPETESSELAVRGTLVAPRQEAPNSGVVSGLFL